MLQCWLLLLATIVKLFCIVSGAILAVRQWYCLAQLFRVQRHLRLTFSSFWHLIFLGISLGRVWNAYCIQCALHVFNYANYFQFLGCINRPRVIVHGYCKRGTALPWSFHNFKYLAPLVFPWNRQSLCILGKTRFAIIMALGIHEFRPRDAEVTDRWLLLLLLAKLKEIVRDNLRWTNGGVRSGFSQYFLSS